MSDTSPPGSFAALLERHAAALGADQGAAQRAHAVTPPDRPGSTKELLAIYQGRALHLGSIATPHAQSLLAEVEALCAGLRASGDGACFIWSLDLGDRGLMIVEDASSKKLLGLCHTVGRGQVTEVEWASLWGQADRTGRGRTP
jgi:hypothetical protein